MSARSIFCVHRLTSWRYLQPRIVNNISRTYPASSNLPIIEHLNETKRYLWVKTIGALSSSSHVPSRKWTIAWRMFLSSDSASSSTGGDGEEEDLNEEAKKHPDAEKEPLPEWPDGVNPHTGEKGGPRGPEPTRYGDWERKGRVTDF